MKIKASSCVLVLLLATSFVFGQDFTFKVLVNKGKNEVKTGTSWEPLKVGATLNSKDELKLTQNAYVGLIHVTGKPLEVKKAGNHKVLDLDALVGKGGTSVLNKYTDFILSSSKEKRNNLSATGAVHRGPKEIKMFLPSSELAYIYNDSVTLNWSDDETKGPFMVSFINFFSDTLYKVETPVKSITINLGAEEFAADDDIQVIVTSKSDDKASAAYSLRKLSKVNRERISESRKEIATQIAEETALNKLVEAGFYEQQKLLIDAATALQRAIELEPEVTMYQEAYNEFLIRNGLKGAKDK
jgi:hypothetical protein